MKLERLHLKAFGGFEDHELDLSEGAHGLHVVFGPNEAGKSTTLRAITQLLYGIPSQTGDDFRHPMPSLRIGATISNGSESLSFLRRKGLKGTLLGEDDKTTLDDDVLTPFLGGVDEAAFTHLFGLSHEQLVRGGQALIQGEGDVGQALFSAASGLGNLRKVLDRLEQEAGELFAPRGSKPRLNMALSKFREAKAAIKLAQVLPKAWIEITTALEERRQSRESLVVTIKDLVADQNRLERMEKALPLVSQYRDIQRRLEEMGGTVVLPDDFHERRIAASQALASAREQHQVAMAGLARINAQLDSLDVDGDLLAQEARIERLHGTHEVIRKALDDKERKLAPQLHGYHADTTRLLRDLQCSQDDAESLRPEPGVESHVNELARTRQAIDRDEAHGREQLAKLEASRKQLSVELKNVQEAVDATRLDSTVKSARPLAVMEEDMANRAENLTRLREGIESALTRLAFPKTSRKNLDTLPVPGRKTIEQTRLQMDAEAHELRRIGEELKAVQAERDDIALQLDAYRRTQQVPTEADLTADRAHRETAWRRARTAWESGDKPDSIPADEVRALMETVKGDGSGNLADLLERLTQRADDTADRLRRESDRAAAVAQLESRHDAMAARLAELTSARTRLEEKQVETQAAWVSQWEALGLTPKSPVEMAEWHSDYEALLNDLARAKEEEGTLETYNGRAKKQRAQLIAAMDELGLKPDSDKTLSDLIGLAESTVETLRERAQQRDHLQTQLAQTESELTVLEQSLERLITQRKSWAEEWRDMMARIGARSDASPAEASARIDILEALFDTLDKAAELEGRIAQIDADNEAYLEGVDELAHLASATGVDLPRESLVPALFQALKTHRQQATEQAGLLKQRAEQEELLATSDAALERSESELADLSALAKLDDLAALEEAESRSRQYTTLQNEQRSLEARLLDISPGLGLEEFLSMVSAEEPGAIAARLNAIGPERDEAEAQRDALSQAIGELENDRARMDGSGKAAALAGDAEVLLADMTEYAREYARLKAAHFVLSEAIERYRAANQEPLLARASEIFKTLTLESFHELRTDYDNKGNHVLCGYREGRDTPVHVAGMSEGTADQLYLALRLASLERHLARHAPIPFVLDDILVNFDDQRAAATLKVLASISDQTQVIYFTHHEHIVNLAKKHVGKKRLFTHALNGQN